MTQQPPPRPHARVVRAALIVSGALALLGLIVGLVQHSDASGASCGSPLIPRDITAARVAPCEWALSGGTTLMCTLFAFAVIVLLSHILAILTADTQR
jgi:hypothetical protein